MQNRLVLMVALTSAPVVAAADDSPTPNVGPVVRVEQPLDRDEVRSWYRDLASRTTKRSRMPVGEAVPQLVALHEVVGDLEGLSMVESRRMQVTLRGRLTWYEHRLRKQVAEGERTARRGDGTSSAKGGGASLAGARSLIDLIQRTINPPIWNVNGGPAGIGYFAPVQALVVRAPGEVHHQLGGTLGALRRAGP